MKGLVLKDFYLLTRYCRNFLLVAFVFLVMYISNPGNTAAITMLCAVTGILPITLLSYDEREGWITYCQTLPYTKGQYVSAKYVMGLFVCLGSMVLLGLLVIFLPGGLVGLLPLVLSTGAAACLVPAALMLPFSFRYGTEKARVLYFFCIGLFIAGMGLVAANLDGRFDQGRLAQILALLPALLCGVSAVLYGASWLASIAWYRRREA